MRDPHSPANAPILAPGASRVFVESEFAPLRTVVLARSQVRLSDPDIYTPEQLALESSILPPEQRATLMALLGRDHADAMPVRQALWEGERDALAAVFQKYGITVLHPRMLTQWEKLAGGKLGYSNSFVRDPWFTVGDVVIEASLRFPHRRQEVLPSRALLLEHVQPAECLYVAVPQPEIMPLEMDGGGPGPFLEGGDVLVLGRDVLVGVSGRASTLAGAEWLRKLLAPRGYIVHTVPLKSSVLHLDCALGLVREGLMTVCDAVLPEGLPARLAGWDRITVTEDEAKNLGTNGLPITPDLYVTDPVFDRIGDAIARHGITVETVDFAISRSFGGAFRCSTQALWRE